jgi:hypothetical protein
VALSSKYSIVVSLCTVNRVALLWDLNRRRLVRELHLSPALTEKYKSDTYALSIDEVPLLELFSGR